MRDESILKAVAQAINAQVDGLVEVFKGKFDAIEQRIKDLPVPVQGPPGAQGEHGEPGLAGKDGVNGQDGKQGEPGPAGRDGINGVPGKDGAPGHDGEAGPQGKQGEKGIDGAAGRDGKDGEPGAKGLDGANGKDGSNGINGKDAPAVDIKALSEAITEKVLAVIPKPKDGLDGKDGASVGLETVRAILISEVNKAVEAIPKPAAGRDGRDGRKGEAGLPGKDADEIDVLPGIDEGSAYPQGTRAEYRGGEIRAYRTTDPIADGDIEAAGWTVTRNGIQNIVEEMAPDGRTRITSYVMTNGKSVVTKLKMYVPQHKGVWSNGQNYELGDYVTMAGAQWHSNRTNKDRPGTSDAWTLVVKRGSDGKDLTNGTRQ